MKLPNTLSIDSLEAAFATWDENESTTLTLPVRMPKPLPFCVEAPLLQFIASISRKLNSGMTVEFEGLSKDSSDYRETLKNALGSPHALCAWIMSSQVSDANGKLLPKSDSRVFSDFLDAMDEYNFLSTHASGSDRVNLICVQGASREYIEPLYQSSGEKHVIRPHPQIRLLVQDILALLAPHWTGRELRDVAIPLGQLIKELMENADWWARTDESGVPYKKGKGFRTLGFRMVDVDEDNANLFAGTNTHLHNYVQTTLLENGQLDSSQTSSKGSAIKKHSFVEVSIVDSGPGLVRRWLSSREVDKKVVLNLDSISLEEEQGAIAECFQKWATSSHNSLRGIGLFSVAKMLREQNGFMRLRTGRLSYLFGTKSAVKDVDLRVKGKVLEDGPRYLRLDDGTHVFLEDRKVVFFLRPWGSEELRAVEGTSYSILLPV